MRDRYQVQFELDMSVATSMNNYEYLDLLDRGWSSAGMGWPMMGWPMVGSPMSGRPVGGVLVDIGCASFWYAASLQAFFRPQRLVGVEVEGHRLLRDGRTRIDYARGYLARLPNAQFVVADYTRYEEPADLITSWFPFLTPAAILAWRLPLSLLEPDRLFGRIRHNLLPGGLFFMVNHGTAEAALAERLCAAAGLHRVGLWTGPGILSRHRMLPPVLSWWRAKLP